MFALFLPRVRKNNNNYTPNFNILYKNISIKLSIYHNIFECQLYNVFIIQYLPNGKLWYSESLFVLYLYKG